MSAVDPDIMGNIGEKAPKPEPLPIPTDMEQLAIRRTAFLSHAEELLLKAERLQAAERWMTNHLAGLVEDEGFAIGLAEWEALAGAAHLHLFSAAEAFGAYMDDVDRLDAYEAEDDVWDGYSLMVDNGIPMWLACLPCPHELGRLTDGLGPQGWWPDRYRQVTASTDLGGMVKHEEVCRLFERPVAERLAFVRRARAHSVVCPA